MRKSYLAGTLLSIPVILVAASTPASALVSAATASCGINWSQMCSGYEQDVPGLGTAATGVAVSCTAATPFLVDATIVQCYIRGSQGDEHWTPPKLTQGPVSTVVATFGASELRSRAYQVCVLAGYYNGAYHEQDNATCGTGI